MNYEKNIEILNSFERVFGNEKSVNFQIKGSDGELRKVSKEKFAEWMTEGKEEKNIQTPPKEKIVVGASGDIDGTTVFTETISKDGAFRESYSWPRSEEEKKQIIERNKERREKELEDKKEKSQNEQAKEINSTNPVQKNEVQVQKPSSNDSSLKSKSLVWGSISAIGLLGVVAVVIKVKKSKKKSF